MKISRINLINIGIYEGEDNTIELLSNKSSKKLTLIIGKNGAGKTTMLNSIKVAFYGSLLFNVKSMNFEYKSFLLDLLNKNAMKQSNNLYSIEVNFISNILGADGEYTLKRSWEYSPTKLNESLEIHKGTSLLNIEETESFINKFHQSYPIELFDLFFFDGEKIDQLSILNHNIVSVLETAFNLSQYRTLKADLEKYAVNKVKNSDLNKLEMLKTSVQNEIFTLEESKKELRNSVQIKIDELLLYESKIKELSINGFENLDHLNNDSIKILQNELDELNKSYKSQITEMLPFTIIKSDIKNLIKQLKIENKTKQYEIIEKELSRINVDTIKNEINDVDQESIEAVLNAIINRFQNKSGTEKIHNVTPEEYHYFKNFDLKLEKYSYSDFKKLQTELISKRNNLESLKKGFLNKQSDEYKIHLNDLLNSQNRTTELKIEIDSINEKLETIEIQLNQKLNEKESIDKNIWKQIKTSNVDQIVVKANNVLDKYIAEIRRNKLQSIEEDTLKMFNQILRKKDFIKSIELHDHGIDFYDYKNNKLSHKNLSAGERQIFTLSLLVSILNTTKRITPLIFDTLLGRLDQSHKNGLLNELITNVSDQIIILATDAEIDDPLMKSIQPQINNIITIDLSSAKNKIMNGVQYEN